MMWCPVYQLMDSILYGPLRSDLLLQPTRKIKIQWFVLFIFFFHIFMNQLWPKLFLLFSDTQYLNRNDVLIFRAGDNIKSFVPRVLLVCNLFNL